MEYLFPTKLATIKSVNAAAIAGPFATPSLALLKEPPNQGMTDAEVLALEADYTGYAREAVTWSAATVSDSGIPEYLGTAGEFRPTGTTVQNSIQGVALVATDGTTVLQFVATEPMAMASAEDAILITIQERPTRDSVVTIVS